MSTRSISRWPALTKDVFDYSVFPRIWDINEFMGTDWTMNVPSINVLENDDHYRIELAAPGLNKEDFKISVENRMITISAECTEDKKEEKENYMRREFAYNAFRRTLRLPENCVTDHIDAKYESGVLLLTIPKKVMSSPQSAKNIKVS